MNCTLSPSFFIYFLTLLISPIGLIAQEELALDTSQQINSIQEPPPTTMGAYRSTQELNKTSAIQTLMYNDFNKGIISDPLLLVQGKLAGVQSYNRGNDPNGNTNFRIRGLSRFAQKNTPLIVIDGVTAANLNSIDPNNIKSITVLKDAASQAMYGMQAANGVVLIESRQKDFENDSIAIRYSSELGLSMSSKKWPLLSAEEFRAAGGIDLGSNTNWHDQILRQGISQSHGLAIHGRTLNTQYTLAGNFRNVNGILLNSGFTQYNLRGQLRNTFLKNKLKLQIQAAYTNRSSDIGIEEAFAQAISYTATAPVLGSDAIFAFNEDQFGGYFETIGLFDSHNPASLVNLNERTAFAENLSSSALLNYQVIPELALNLRYSLQKSFDNQRAIYSPFSLFRGNANSPIAEHKGAADLLDIENNFALYEVFLKHRRNFNDIDVEFIVGTAIHEGRFEESYAEVSGYRDVERVSRKKIGGVGDLIRNAASFDTIRNAWNDDIHSLFSSVQFNIKDQLFINASLRSDASSKLGIESQRGFFPALGLGLNLVEMLQLQKMHIAHLRFSYGKTGGLPAEGGLSKRRIRRRILGDGLIIEDEQRATNRELSWEKKNEYNLGLDVGAGLIRSSIDVYHKTFTDGIGEEFLFPSRRYKNLYSFTAQGLDLNLQASVLQNKNTEIKTGVQFSYFSNTVENLADTLDVISGPGGIRQEAIIVLQNGESLGSVYAPEFSGQVTGDGIPVFVDVNRDGTTQTAPSLFDPDGDYIKLGTGVPTCELGWYTHLQHKGWQIFANFRAAFGHVLINRTRLLHEPKPLNPIYNLVETDLVEPNLRINRYSSLYVENADFIKLDNLSIRKQLQLSNLNNAELQISLTAQNLFTMSSYTGLDPEPALEDNSFRAGSRNLYTFDSYNTALSGVDRRKSYLPSRNFILGIELIF